jgi:large subunit ribosomal protein L4
MELAVFNIKGEDTGKKAVLSDTVFGIEPNDHAIYLDVKQHMANKRQGTHKSKERGEIAGSTRKIKRQKGTGTARAGSIKNPLFKGGGRVFGPQPRDYSFKLNKKVKQLARKSALSYKAKDNGIMILEDFTFEQPKTRDYLSVMNNLKIQGKKSLLVLSDTDKNLFYSSRNIPKARVINVSELNTYDIMNSSVVVFVESSIDMVDKLFTN